MTIALWCILIASFLPVLFAGLAKSKMKLANNAAPREFKRKLTGWRQRAYWAELNSHESFPPFAAAVVVAHLLSADQNIVDVLAMGYILARLGYGACYILDWPMLRSVVWFAGVVCTIGLYGIASL